MSEAEQAATPMSPAVRQTILATIGQGAMAKAPPNTGVAMLVFLPAGPGEKREAQLISNMPEESVIAAMQGTIATLERQIAARTQPPAAQAKSHQHPQHQASGPSD